MRASFAARSGSRTRPRGRHAAHIRGFCCGLLGSLAALPMERAIFRLKPAKQTVAQAVLFLAGLAVIVGAWHYAPFK